MGFLKPDLPVVDFAEWSKGTRAEKIRPMAKHWAEVGFGTPVVLHLFYVVKIGLYILGGWLVALSTTGIDGFTDVAGWWSEPIVFEKVVLYTMLFEVVGLGRSEEHTSELQSRGQLVCRLQLEKKNRESITDKL